MKVIRYNLYRNFGPKLLKVVPCGTAEAESCDELTFVELKSTLEFAC